MSRRRLVAALAGCALALPVCSCSTSGTLLRPGDAGAADAGQRDAGPTYCTSRAASFCADFDHGATPGSGFDGIDTAGGATLELVDTNTTSPPKALRSALPNLVADEAHARAELLHRFSLAGRTSVSVDLAMRVSAGAPLPDEIVRTFAVLIDGGSIGLFRAADRWFLAIHRDNVGGDEDEEPLLREPVPTETWVRIHLEIALGRAPTAGRVRLTVDDQERLARTISTHGDAQPLSEGALVLGLARAAGAVSAAQVDLDDVVLQATP